MKPFSQRRAFTGLMSLLATAFVIGITGEVLGGQPDLKTDILKIGGLVSVGTAVVSYIAWTIIQQKKGSLKRGAFAGGLTASAIIPLPAFAWTLKTQTLAAYHDTADNIFMALLSALPRAISSGLWTFVDITKASLIAIVGSIILGAAITHYVPNQKPSPKI